ncbi:MAG: hypothetical protein CMM59_04820 [Rhodospirillaceae bacterium]|nr:hypothetical protein [Rhodospirillaceae bacterium]
MQRNLSGLLFLTVFALSQAVRDTFFANTFQSVSFLFVAALAFGMSTLLFGGWAVLRAPQEIRFLSGRPARFAVLNLTTALAWLAYFFALKHLEPAIVSMIYVGVGPLVILFWSGGERPGHMRFAECAAYTGIAAALAGIAYVVLFGHSGLQSDDATLRTGALIAVVIGGVSITVSHVIARQFNDDGASSNLVFASRFLIVVATAAAAEAIFGSPALRPEGSQLGWIALCAFALIVIPSFSLQLGIARSSPLSVNVIRAMGPVFVFAAQQLDDRLSFSSATLLCILLFSISASAASGLRAHAELRQTRD